MPIVPANTLNLTALVVPDLYVVIVPPQILLLNGVPSNVVGIVGTATWGPVNTPAIISPSNQALTFGPLIARKYDMGTHWATAVQQGAQAFRCVRVTDGTDTAASVVAVASCITFTGLYTGTLGNNITVSLAGGSKVGTMRAVVGLPGLNPEVFDNIPGGGPAWVTATPYSVGQVVSSSSNAYICTVAGTSSSAPTGTGNNIADGAVRWNYVGTVNAFWVALAAAINNGTSNQRGPSQIITATAGAGTTAPVPASYSLTGGTDGVATINDSVLIGQDTLPRKGMYALRSQGCSVGLLADADGGSNGSSNQWTAQASFGASEGIYMICTGPAGDTIANAVTTKAAAGLDNPWAKLMFGDWLWWADPANNITRLVSPQGFVAGKLGNLSPEQSTLNKQLSQILGSQKSGLPNSGQQQVYASADLQTLFLAGIDVISNPAPGGSIWAVRCGHNSSSNAGTNGDNYTRLTDYIAATLNAGMGLYVGQVINLTMMSNVRATLLAFLNAMLNVGQLGTLDGSLPFSVVCDLTNNLATQVELGYLTANVSVQYQAINEKFIVNLQGGQTVQVQQQTVGGVPAA